MVANAFPGDAALQSSLSIIEDGPHPNVRMAHLAIVGSFSVNGVAALHTELLREGLFAHFCKIWPDKFNNKTNGVTQRRWLADCNPGLRDLINSTIGEGWVTDLDQLKALVPYANKAPFRKKWAAVKQANKEQLAQLIFDHTGLKVNTQAMFDVQVKRIHEYKRQLLNILHAIHLYQRIKSGHTDNWTPRCIIIGGKAAPGYAMAKDIIKLCNNVADVINQDPACEGLLQMVFIPNYNVTKMQTICAGTDLSEQISTAGKEASGTGNMKFMMNGALTIGTLDGANIEIREECGDEHFFLFGLTAEEVEAHRGHHDPQLAIAADDDLQAVMQLLTGGHFNQCEPGIFNDIINSLTTWGDHWMVLADFRAFVIAQEAAAEAYRDTKRWWKSSIINSATSGKFSTDRTMREYNNDIWQLKAVQPGKFEGSSLYAVEFHHEQHEGHEDIQL